MIKLEAKVEARMTKLEAKVEARMSQLEARVAKVEELVKPIPAMVRMLQAIAARLDVQVEAPMAGSTLHGDDGSGADIESVGGGH